MSENEPKGESKPEKKPAESRPVADPLALWRDMLGQWERSVNALANRTMGSEEFSGPMNQAMNASLRAQQTLSDTMARFLASLNLPSRNDLERLAEQLGAIEARLGQIADILEHQSRHKKKKDHHHNHGDRRQKMPPRTKKPRSGAP